MTDQSPPAPKAIVTELPKTDEAGRLLAGDGLPAHAHARAAALAAKGVKSDPLKLVSDELIELSGATVPEKKAAPAASKE